LRTGVYDHLVPVVLFFTFFLPLWKRASFISRSAIFFVIIVGSLAIFYFKLAYIIVILVILIKDNGDSGSVVKFLFGGVGIGFAITHFLIIIHVVVSYLLTEINKLVVFLAVYRLAQQVLDFFLLVKIFFPTFCVFKDLKHSICCRPH